MIKKDIWDREIFSTSVNTILEQGANSDGYDLFQLIEAIYSVHPEYGFEDPRSYLPQGSGTGIKFKEFFDFLRENKSSLNQEHITIEKWLDKILNIVKPLPPNQVINGRFFLYALILSEYQSVSSAVNDKDVWAEKSKMLAQQLEAELQNSEKIDVQLFLTSEGKALRNAAFEFLGSLAAKRSTNDGPAFEDLLSRDAFAEYLSNRLRYVYKNHVRAEQDPLHSSPRIDNNGRKPASPKRETAEFKSRAFLMLVDGEWGSGKSTLLYFLKKHLENYQSNLSRSKDSKSDKKNWIVVEFNAWQNQRLDAPWWFIMKSVHNSIIKHYKEKRNEKWRKLWLKEIWWRSNIGSNYLFAAALTFLLFVLALIIGIKSEEAWKSLPVIQFATFIGFLWSLTKFLRTSLVDGSARSARQFMDENGADPMAALTRHFTQKLETIDYPVAIFIDDLDRCNKDYAVKLLEGMQTIFMHAPVIYVVAADKKWIRTIYESEYNIFSDNISRPGKPFGLVFLDKTFQFTVELPAISNKQKMVYWNYLLDIAPDDKDEELRKIRSSADAKLSQLQSNADREKVINHAGNKPIEQQVMREQIVRSIVIGEEQKVLQDHLQQYIELLEPNPRSMKRVLNDISTSKTMAFLYSIYVNEAQLILWTIMKLQYPSLASFFWENPEKLRVIQNDIIANHVVKIDDKYDALFLNVDIRKLFRFTVNGKIVAFDTDFIQRMKFETNEKAEQPTISASFVQESIIQ